MDVDGEDTYKMICTAVRIKLDFHIILAWILSALITNQFIQRARIVPKSKAIYSEQMVVHHLPTSPPRIFPGRSRRSSPGKSLPSF
jgi:hypothetical protein